MQEEPRNYGRMREPGDAEGYSESYHGGGPSSEHPPGGPTGTLSPQDERTWSMLSHLSVLVWPVTGFLPIAPLIIWLVYKDRSPRVGFHALQSLWYQVAWLVLGTVGGFVAVLFTLITFGLGVFVVAPLAVILGLVPFVHQLYAAYKVYGGEDYRYPFIADRIDGGARMV
jgi:uncharacterized protein